MKRAVILIAVLTASAFLTDCASTRVDETARAASAFAFATVFEVLQHPRCMHCHPTGRAPLQGDDHRPHGQNVQGGRDGKGMYAMRCVTCHQTQNVPGLNTPPGAPNWHLPSADMPLVFQGRSASELARQLSDPAQNGGMSGEQMLKHVSEDPLVLWGWNPGAGRDPVAVPHAEFVAAMRAWIVGGCAIPD